MAGDENKDVIVKQLCAISIAFPVTSDDEAIEYKKKLTAVLMDIEKARIDFSLSAMPINPNTGKPLEV